MRPSAKQLKELNLTEPQFEILERGMKDKNRQVWRYGQLGKSFDALRSNGYLEVVLRLDDDERRAKQIEQKRYIENAKAQLRADDWTGAYYWLDKATTLQQELDAKINRVTEKGARVVAAIKGAA